MGMGPHYRAYNNQGAKVDTGAKVLEANLSLNWTGLSKIIYVGSFPLDVTPHDCPVATNLL